MHSLEVQSEQEGIDAARQQMQAAQAFKEQILLFVHGYNVSFDNAVRRAGQIAYDVNFDGPCGGKPLSETDPTVVDDLRRLVEPATLGSPVQPLRWVSKGRGKLAGALREMGHKISANTVGKLLTTGTATAPSRPTSALT